MRQITKDINTLSENDMINVLLFGLYKLSGIPEYSAISDLIYVLDKDSFYKLCAAYGGCTIRIPTINELKILTKSLLIYKHTCEGVSFNDACSLVDIDVVDKQSVIKMYSILLNILEDYCSEQS